MTDNLEILEILEQYDMVDLPTKCSTIKALNSSNGTRFNRLSIRMLFQLTPKLGHYRSGGGTTPRFPQHAVKIYYCLPPLPFPIKHKVSSRDHFGALEYGERYEFFRYSVIFPHEGRKSEDHLCSCLEAPRALSRVERAGAIK